MKVRAEASARLAASGLIPADAASELRAMFPDLTEQAANALAVRADACVRLASNGFGLGIEWPDIAIELRTLFPDLTIDEENAARIFGQASAEFLGEDFGLRTSPRTPPKYSQ